MPDVSHFTTPDLLIILSNLNIPFVYIREYLALDA